MQISKKLDLERYVQNRDTFCSKNSSIQSIYSKEAGSSFLSAVFAFTCTQLQAIRLKKNSTQKQIFGNFTALQTCWRVQITIFLQIYTAILLEIAKKLTVLSKQQSIQQFVANPLAFHYEMTLQPYPILVWKIKNHNLLKSSELLER